MKLKVKPKLPPAVFLYKETIRNLSKSQVDHNDLIMSKLRGNPNSRLLLVTPPSTADEYEHGIPFSNDAAAAFHGLMQDHGLDTQKHFLVVACSVYGESASKASTELVKTYVANLTRMGYIDFVVCVGDAAFKFLFGNGKKPASNSLFGSTVFIPETNHKPLVTLPEPAMLVIPAGLELEPWQMRRAENVVTNNIYHYHRYLRQLVASLKQQNIKLK